MVTAVIDSSHNVFRLDLTATAHLRVMTEVRRNDHTHLLSHAESSFRVRSGR
jgi:hypothetical protein